jgi:two-component system, OmpR family, sensor histidine kinase ChvG
MKSSARWWWRIAGMLLFLLLLLALIVRTERAGRLSAGEAAIAEVNALTTALDLDRLSVLSSNGLAVRPALDGSLSADALILEPTSALAEPIVLGADSTARLSLESADDTLYLKLAVDTPRRGVGGLKYGDDLELGVDTLRGHFRYALKAVGSEAIDGVPEAGTSSLNFAPSVSGRYRETPSGYWMVLSLSPKRDVRALGFRFRDARQALALRPILSVPNEIERGLERLATARMRLALLDSSGAMLSYAALPDYREPTDPGAIARLACFLSGGLERRGWWRGDAEPFSQRDPPTLSSDALELRWSAPAGRGCQRRLELLKPLQGNGLILWIGREWGVTPGLEEGIDKAFARSGLSIALLALVVLYGWIEFKRLRLKRLHRAVAGSGLADIAPGERRLIHALPDEISDLATRITTLKRDVADYTGYLNSLAGKLSHELNTPLAVVRSSLDNLDHLALDDDARTYAERARQGADRLNGILRAMGEASRIERAIDAAECEDFDLTTVVRNLHAAYEDLTAPRELKLHLPSEPCVVSGAPELIAQALDKLIDNALSFTPPAGFIELNLHPQRRGFLLSVANSGPPLKDDMRAKLFDSLVSLRQGRSESPHLGLGLYIVRLIATLHQGRAWAENLPDGAGVKFCVEIIGMPRRR